MPKPAPEISPVVIEQLKTHAATLFVEACRATGLLKAFSPDTAAEVLRAAQDAISTLAGGN
jgi:hypothetical protein